VSRSASERLLFLGAQAPLTGWTIVVARGRHAGRFLHSQLTSDVLGLAPGTSQQTALLDRGGRLKAFGFLHHRDDRFELLLPTAAVDPAVQSLEEHIIADDVVLEVIRSPRLRLALGAEAVRRASSAATQTCFPIEIYGSRGFVTWGAEELDLAPIDEHEIERRRVLTGLPRWGNEAGEGTLIHSTTLLETAVASDKGCYLGQETVAKVTSGRGAARAPILLEVLSNVSEDAVLIGRSFSTEWSPRSGKVLSAARWNGKLILQATVVRQLRVEDREFVCTFEGGQTIDVRAHALPYLETPRPETWAREIELRAVAEFSEDREEEALQLYERAIAVCPWYADAYEALGVILGRHGRYEEAITLMKRLLEVDPSSVMAHTNLSLFYNQLGRIEDAEREAAEAARATMRREQEGRRPEASMRDEDEAIASDRERRAEMFRQVLELDAEDPLGNFGLGELLVEEGRFGEAVVHLERALDADPRYSAALLALGRALEGSDDLESARTTYRRGIDIAAAAGDLATAHTMQARLAVLQGDPSES
jgi:folate-binding protein YgfZ